MRKYLVVFGLIGLLVPFFFEFVWHFVKEGFGSWFIVLLWPSFIFLDDPGRPMNARFGYMVLSIAVNGLFYCTIGFFLWGLFHKSRWFLLVFILPVLWFCYRVFVLVH
ncbi:MAG: hypothetical protein ACYDFU_03295 [Nitrospirota bacterium]